MKGYLGMIVLLSCLRFQTAFAEPPSDASIEEMLRLSNAEQLLETVKGQMSGFMKSSVAQLTQGQTLSPKRQAVADRMIEQMSAAMQEVLSWDSLKPMYIRIYRVSFTQEDVDGINAFYRTAAGQAMISKLPLVMQNVMSEMQGMLKPMQQKMIEIQHQAVEDIKKARDE